MGHRRHLAPPIYDPTLPQVYLVLVQQATTKDGSVMSAIEVKN